MGDDDFPPDEVPIGQFHVDRVAGQGVQIGSRTVQHNHTYLNLKWGGGAALVMLVVALFVFVMSLRGSDPISAAPTDGSGPHLTYVVQRVDPGDADDFWALRDRLDTDAIDEVPAVGKAFHDWIRPHGGVQVNKEFTRVELTNPRPGQVRIIGLEAVVGHLETAYSGSLFCEHSQGNGQINEVEFNLADAEPQARAANGQGDGPPYFTDHGDITLEQGETITLAITAFPPPGKLAEWSPVVEYTVDGGKPQHTTITGETPFRVSARAAQYGVYLQSSGKYSTSVRWTRPEGRYEPVPENAC